LAGAPADIVQSHLHSLPTRANRQAALCTACGILSEAAASCQERADEIANFLANNCLVFGLGGKPCALKEIYGMKLDALA